VGEVLGASWIERAYSSHLREKRSDPRRDLRQGASSQTICGIKALSRKKVAPVLQPSKGRSCSQSGSSATGSGIRARDEFFNPGHIRN
jgi:hypothetical protein